MPVNLCFITWPCLSVSVYHVTVSVCNLSRDYAYLTVPVTWLCFSVCVYHVTAPFSCFITWECMHTFLVYHVTMNVGLYLLRDRAFDKCFVTWLCPSVCFIMRVCANSFCTLSKLQSLQLHSNTLVLQYVSVLVYLVLQYVSVLVYLVLQCLCSCLLGAAMSLFLSTPSISQLKRINCCVILYLKYWFPY